MSDENTSDKKIKIEVFRLITPGLVAVLGWMCLHEIDRVESTLKESNMNVASLTVSVGEIRANVQSIQDRLVRDETIYDRKGFR